MDVRNCKASIAYSETDGLGAIERGLLRAIAIIERPGASSADRNCAGQPNSDRMIYGGEITLLDVIAIAGLAHTAEEIDA